MVDIERNDSGLGSETGGKIRNKTRTNGDRRSAPVLVKKRLAPGGASSSSGGSGGTGTNRSVSSSSSSASSRSGSGSSHTSGVIVKKKGSTADLHICEDCDQTIEDTQQSVQID